MFGVRCAVSAAKIVGLFVTRDHKFTKNITHILTLCLNTYQITTEHVPIFSQTV